MLQLLTDLRTPVRGPLCIKVVKGIVFQALAKFAWVADEKNLIPATAITAAMQQTR